MNLIKQYLDDKVLGLKQILALDPTNKVVQIEYNAKLAEQQTVKEQLEKTFQAEQL